MPEEMANAMDSGSEIAPTTIPATVSRKRRLADNPSRILLLQAVQKSAKWARFIPIRRLIINSLSIATLFWLRLIGFHSLLGVDPGRESLILILHMRGSQLAERSGT
jgi:hypothetical protein